MSRTDAILDVGNAYEALDALAACIIDVPRADTKFLNGVAFICTCLADRLRVACDKLDDAIPA